MSTYRFGFPTPIHFGPGIRKQLGEFVKAQGSLRPLVVTDKGIAGLPFCKEILGILSAAGLQPECYSGVAGNPVESQVTEGVAAYRRHRADLIVGLGGGAALDVSKTIALMVNHPGNLFDYSGDSPSRAVDGEVPAWVAVPTTAGTGSEVGRSAVISDESHTKRAVFSPKFLARAVFADPELTLELPKGVTAATGMDALTHCVESYLSKPFHPICDGIAIEGVRLASTALPRCVKNPGDIEARGLMMMVSIMGGIAFQKDLGITHSCAHALGTIKDLHHGLANGIMINYALKFNLEASPERFRILGMMVGLKDPTPAAFIGWLEKLKAEIGIPARLSEVGVTRDQIEPMVKIASQDYCNQFNIRPVTPDALRAIFTEAL